MCEPVNQKDRENEVRCTYTAYAWRGIRACYIKGYLFHAHAHGNEKKGTKVEPVCVCDSMMFKEDLRMCFTHQRGRDQYHEWLMNCYSMSDDIPPGYGGGEQIIKKS